MGVFSLTKCVGFGKAAHNLSSLSSLDKVENSPEEVQNSPNSCKNKVDARQKEANFIQADRGCGGDKDICKKKKDVHSGGRTNTNMRKKEDVGGRNKQGQKEKQKYS